MNEGWPFLSGSQKAGFREHAFQNSATHSKVLT